MCHLKTLLNLKSRCFPIPVYQWYLCVLLRVGNVCVCFRVCEWQWGKGKVGVEVLEPHTRTWHLRSDWSVALIYSSQVDAEDQKTYKCHKFWQRNTLFILSTGPYFGWEVRNTKYSSLTINKCIAFAVLRYKSSLAVKRLTGWPTKDFSWLWNRFFTHNSPFSIHIELSPSRRKRPPH